MSAPPTVDARVPRFTSAVTLALLVLAAGTTAVGLDARPVVGAAALLLFAAWATNGRANLPGLLFARVVRPALRLPPGEREDARPPRFANLLGWAFLGAALGALSSPVAPVAAGGVGWSLVALVAGLAGLNAATGFCVGCRFYRLGRRLFGKPLRATAETSPT